MKFKSKILCLLLVLVMLLTISAVAANENTILSLKEDSTDQMSVNVETNNEILGISNSEYNLGAPDDGTFTSLQKKINNTAEGGTLVLENNYTNTNWNFRYGITISKSLTIDGNGFTIDVRKTGRIFQVTAANVTLKNINFVNTNTIDINKGGGAVYWSGANGVLSGSNFINNSAAGNDFTNGGDGGAVYWSGANGTLSDSNFTANKAIFGGAVYWDGANGVLSGCNFTGNNATWSDGGAVYWSGADGRLSGCNFTGNKKGGAVYWIGARGILSGSNFINNSDAEGGAVYWGNGATRGSLSDSIFINNSASNGGAVYWRGADGRLSGSTFIGNNASRCGAVYWSGARGILSGSNFINNSARKFSAGAVYWYGADGTLRDSNFTRNSARQEGGAVYWSGINYGSNPNAGNRGVLSGSNFINNSAGNGGAVFWNGANGRLSGSNFIGNNASNGGVVYWKAYKGTLSGSNFTSNSASVDGGAVYWAGTNGNLTGSNFIGNNASYGGAVFWNGTGGVLDNCSFVNCSAESFSNYTTQKSYVNAYGGAVYWNGTGGVLGNCSFVNCSAESFSNYTTQNSYVNAYGGAVYWYGANGTLDNCSFVNCSAESLSYHTQDSYVNAYGGAVYWYGANGTLDNCSFVNCSVESFSNYGKYSNVYACGGAVYWYGANGTLDNCSFVNCSAYSFYNTENVVSLRDFGGAVFWFGENGRLSGSTFINNIVKGTYRRGGAVYWHGSYGVLSGSNFTDNKDALEGSAVYWKGEFGCLCGSNFTNNSASEGGAVYWNGARGTIYICSFVNCNATSLGGAVRWEANNGRLSGSNFTGNNALVGGAVHWSGINGRLSGSSFTGNNATRFGGAVFWSGYYGSLSGSNFTGNSVTERGGAVYWGGYMGNLSSSNFTSNSASEGGAVYGNGYESSLSGSSFLANNAILGGAVYWFSGYGSLSGSNFTGNNATRYGGAVHWNALDGNLSGSSFLANNAILGGAVYWTGARGILSGSNFTGNNASSGGAVHWSGNNGRLSGSNFTGNNATRFGGAVDWDGDDGRLSDSNFNNNRATLFDGGAVYWIGARGILSGSNFTGNNASSGGAVRWNALDGNLTDSNFTNNSASDGGAVYWNSANGSLSGSSFTGNNATSYGGAVHWSGRDGRLSGSSFTGNNATKGSAIYKFTSSSLIITNTVFGRNRANSDKIVIEVEGNETNNVNVKITFYGNDNIANAIWNANNGGTISLANITCEFSYDGIGREYKTFNKYDAPKAVTNTHYVNGSDELWQSPLENAQLIDINITDSKGNVIYSIVNGTETKKSNVERNLLKAVLPRDVNPVNVTDAQGQIFIKLSNLKASTYKISAKHQIDNYYTMTSNSDSFIVNNTPLINKTVDNPTPVVGEVIKYNLTVVNTGDETIRDNVTLVDALSDGLEYAGNYTISDGSYVNFTQNGKVLTWIVTNITNSTPLVITVNVKVTKAGSWTNNLTLNNKNYTVSANVTTVVVNKTVDNHIPVVGEVVRYNLTVVNTANVTIRDDVTLIDTLSDGLEYDGRYNLIGGDLVSFTRNGKVLTWIVTNITKSAPLVITVNIKVVKAGNWTNNLTLNNNFTVSENITAIDNVNSLNISKITLTQNVHVGSQVTFQIDVINTGNVKLTNVTVYETSFDGLVYDSFKASDLWVYSIIRGVNAWTFKEDLHPGEEISFFTVFNTTTNGTFVNNVVASSDNTIDAQANATVNVLKPDFKVEKIVLTPKVTLGEQASYEVVVHNTGETDLTNIVVEELPDASLIYDHYVDKGLFKHSVVAGKHVWTLDKLTKDEYAGFILYFNTTRAGNISNQIIVKCDEDPENTTVSNNTTVVIPSFSLEKISLTPTVVLGQSTTFQIVIRNTGKAELTNVYFTEDSFDGLIYDSAIGEGIWIHKFENAKHTWTLNDVLEPDEIITLTLRFNTTASGKFTNFVSAASDQTGGVYANASVTVLKPEFKVEKIVLTPKVALGEQVRYEIVIHNTGEANLTNIVVEEMPDASLIFDHYVDGGLFKHSVVAGKHIWTLDKLAKGTYAGFMLYFNTTRAGNVSNQIVVKSDEIPENTTVSNNTTVLLPAFSVEKICLIPNVLVGNQTLFQIVIKNTGKVELTDVYFSEDSFDGLIYDSAIGEGIWTHKFENGKHTWTLNEALEPDELAVLTLRFNTTAKGNYTNFVSASSNQTGVLTANATVHVFEGKVPEPPVQNTTEMDVFKIVITQEAVLGGQITFQFVVHNTGNANLENAKISEILPDGLVYDHFVDYLGLWMYNGDLTWSATRAIVPGEYAGFFVTFNTTKAGKFENHIVVTANNTNTTPGNTSFEVLNPVFTIEKILVEDNIINGGQAVFEIVIHNTGNAPLTNVCVKEFDFNGLIYSDFADYLDLWTYNGDLSWTMKSKLMPGEYAELLVIFNTTDVGNFTNFVSGSSNETGIQIVNSTVHVLDDKPGPEQNSSDDYSMDVFKIVITQEAVLGGQITFQFVVHNTGNKNLENVKISEMLPEGLIYSHFVDYLGLWMYNGDLTWSATRAIVSGEYAGFFVTFNTTKAGKSVNHIVVTANNTNTTPANTSFEVLNPDFTVEKILVEDNIVNGNQAVFEIVVHNTGSASLTNLTVREYFFEGLLYDHFTDYLDLWTYNGDLSWTMNAKLLPGEYVGFFVTFNTTKDGVFTNIVVANSSECDNKFSNTSVSVHNETVDISQICLTPLVIVGNQAIFEIIVRNTGKVNIDNLKLSEFDYEGLIYDHYMDYLGHWINDGITWTLNSTLVPGEVTSLFVVFNTTRVGNFTNVVLANKATADTNELLSANSLEDGIYVSADVEVVKPEYTIEKVALNKTANIGDEVIFEIIVHNTGKVDISNITLRDIPSDGLSYLRFVDDENLWFKNADLSWSLVGNLTSGEYSIFYIVFNATKAGTLENTLVSDNLTSKTTVEVNNPVVPVNPGLIIEAEIITDPVTGQPVLKVTVINTGDVDLDNVFVRPKLPEGLRYGDYYSYDSVWNFNNGAFDLEGILKVAESKSFYIEILGEPGEYLIPIDGGYNNTVTDSTEVFVKILDNSTPGNVTPEDNVKPLKSSIAAGDNATGNPLLMVLVVLIALGITRFRKRD